MGLKKAIKPKYNDPLFIFFGIRADGDKAYLWRLNMSRRLYLSNGISQLMIAVLACALIWTTIVYGQSTPLFEDIDAQAAFALIENNEKETGLHIIDVRTPLEQQRDGAIADAKLVNYYAANFKELMKELDRNATYLVYCRVGGRSKSAQQRMREMGFQRVYNLTNGIIGWKANGYPIVK